MKTLVLETTSPFQGLPELVAYEEGLFEKEGLRIEWVERESSDNSTQVDVQSPKGLDPFSSHGKMLEQGKAVKREVEPGVADDNHIEILKGLRKDEAVIVGPPKTLRFLRDGESAVARANPAEPVLAVPL